MLPSPFVGLGPLFEDALYLAAAGLDETLIRLALAASRPKRRRLRDLSERLDYYERIAQEYAAIDPADFYGEPEPIRPERERLVEKIVGGTISDLSWSSGYEPRLASARDAYLRWKTNLTAHVRLFKHDRPAKAAVIWIPGYRGGPPAIEQRISRALELFESGLDVAAYTTPFQGSRAPLRASRAPLFPSQGNIARTNEGFGQMIWELRGLLKWLFERSAPIVGVAGMSLGGYGAALLGTVEPRVSFLIPFIPLADFTDAVVSHDALRGIEIPETLQAASRRALAIHRPLARAPVVPAERVLIVGGVADRVTGRAHAERLAELFGCEIAWFRGGHILQYGRGEAFAALRGFVARHSSAPPPP